MNNIKGFAYGILTSATFGLIPLFTLPLMAKGMQFDSILFYRFLFAAIALTGIMTYKKGDTCINPVGILLYGFGHVSFLGIQLYVRWDRHYVTFHLSDIRYTYHVIVLPRKNIVGNVVGYWVGNLRGCSSVDQ